MSEIVLLLAVLAATWAVLRISDRWSGPLLPPMTLDDDKATP